ncbi:N-formylglutamate amidohydrolase [Aurantiacibacter xanthus]|uniref:N-formylglutamate amidohydrolase n=1 Tax=Aurantiacibacter xanthus TaxID=1784712 RepID=A0A3A1P6Y6_9SPHN|nr:N-formylglutamate amidohydrolase [Aurantiacibacter xanthus]RIV89564.1 N-formylglutamate amidohydrolase [Aurantiacibacter xanthus]
MTFTPYRQIGTLSRGGIVAVCDHASNHVPDNIELGVTPAVLDKHVGWDIGTAGVVERLVRRHGMAAHLATLSRLVIDLHREEDSQGLIPATSDGILIPGNIGADREARLQAWHRPYHAALTTWLDEADPALILSVHSFTPQLEDKGEPRPWEIALLYNEDDRAAQHAIKYFADQGLVVGENEPYSGRQLNATMNRHAEAHGRPYCAIEIRNDLIANEQGQARFAKLLAQMGETVVHALAQDG